MTVDIVATSVVVERLHNGGAEGDAKKMAAEHEAREPAVWK